ncbi:nicotinate-nucleotide--dimethylbenzimidazole phosphoribosyltransferase [Micromonospora orduensis]|uniref:Nicotinate-nucleotide--dimethylbenzimidazole phosphoribosyltransferase n=1 Tax=Micromonospora orduensis TaxID=1420891 RepID=A0A5C4QKG1_9ACTN|nr:nicotinate-nucleotide--dimethylbenzimidazole phosphoribosyltransferase [Micromonospora orduensis]TNH27281.1 nicotinate-nucleotide--dimethylbenzimidazole phosphoribosyltransferase [Micromonospora orduensis]
MLETTIAAIRPADEAAMAAARELHGRLTKPAGSLGLLEELSVRLAGLAGACPPPLPEPAAVAIFAGDHGVHAQGVSPWPQEVTGQMIGNFLAGGAVVNAFARQAGASVTVVDVGVATPLPTDPAAAPAGSDPAALDPAVTGPAVLDPAVPRLVVASVRRGTRDLTVTAALTRDEALAAVQTGIRIADELIDAGAGILLTGDMGIGNTTPAAALIAAFTGADPLDATGRGTGVDDPTYARKVAVVRAALARHTPDPADPLGVLAAVGGLEHAALAGLILGAAARRTPVLLDGVIAVSAALAAAAFAPAAVCAMVAGHRSAEPGATVALRHLGLDPLIDLGLRLGEGTGALLALPVVTGAVRVLHEVATFDSAGVAEK